MTIGFEMFNRIRYGISALKRRVDDGLLAKAERLESRTTSRRSEPSAAEVIRLMESCDVLCAEINSMVRKLESRKGRSFDDDATRAIR
jgi:hypothetical protein